MPVGCVPPAFLFPGGLPPVGRPRCEQTNMSKNTTLPQTSFADGKKYLLASSMFHIVLNYHDVLYVL